MKWFFNRLQESSSYGGLGLIGLAGQQLMAGMWQAGLISLLSGVLAFAVEERKGEL